MRVMVLLLIVPFAFPAQAGWTTADTTREAVYLGLHVADWGQTLGIAESPNYYESNPILGRNPSRGEVNRYFAVTAIGHAAVAYLLPHEAREVWQYTTIGMEAGIVARNYNVGIEFNF